MSENQEIVIIKRRASHESGHHGGAWKIAFADFMTALMALFLVLWLINSANEKTKTSIARYFNPIKLVDMTPMQKGFQNPSEKEVKAGQAKIKSATESDREKSEGSSPDKPDHDPLPQTKLAKYSEDVLFRDPYAVLSEIANDTEDKTLKNPGNDPVSDNHSINEKGGDVYQDPFAPMTSEVFLQDENNSSNTKVKQAEEKGKEHAPVNEFGAHSSFVKTDDYPNRSENRAKEERRRFSQHMEASVQSTSVLKADDSGLSNEVNQLKKELVDLTKEVTSGVPIVEAMNTQEGILLNLTDDVNYSMFAIGSSEPGKEIIHIMEKIATILKSHKGNVVVRGYTDGRQYRSDNYDNWRLSTSRALMAQYMLIRGGLDPKRIEHVEGYADRHLKQADDPNAAVNRRIEILIRKDKS